MKIGIYDSDKNNVEQIRNIVEEYSKQILVETKMAVFHSRAEITGYGTDGNFPDVLFLSLDLKDNNGIEIAKEINEKSKECQIVFYSENLEYATEVYSTAHTYFVLKEHSSDAISQRPSLSHAPRYFLTSR